MKFLTNFPYLQLAHNTTSDQKNTITGRLNNNTNYWLYKFFRPTLKVQIVIDVAMVLTV